MQSNMHRYSHCSALVLLVGGLSLVTGGILAKAASKPSNPPPAKPTTQPARPQNQARPQTGARPQTNNRPATNSNRPAATTNRPAVPATRQVAPARQPASTTRQPAQPNRQVGTAGHTGQPGPRPGQQPGRTFGGNNQAGGQKFGRQSGLQGKPTVTHTPGGGTRQTYANHAVVDKDRNGRTTHYSNQSRGVEARFDPRTGRASQISVNRGGVHTTIQRGPLGSRRIERTVSVRGGVERVTHYGNWSSVQRPILGRPGYVQRTVFIGGVGGRSYNVVYHSYYYHGAIFYSPVPAVIFAPAYYGWLINPWRRPIVYTAAYWGWAGQPWYGYYGAAFVPYAEYASPDQWLTDYVISASLQQAYDNQQASADAGPPPTPPQITAEEKAILDQDVKNELVREEQVAVNPPVDVTPNAPANKPGVTEEAATVIPEALQDHLFTVYAAPIEAQQAAGQTCNLVEGDMLFRTGNAPNPDNTVDLVVKSSHANPSHTELCSPQAHVKVQLAELQEMYNHKKDLLAEGEQKQAELMGKKRGLPKGPDPKQTQLAQGRVDPDTAAAVAELKQMMADADDTEKEVSAVGTTGS